MIKSETKSASVPVHRRISVAALLNLHKGVDCTALASDEELVQSIVETFSDNNVREDSVDNAFNHDDEKENIEYIDDQLTDNARIKRIVNYRSDKMEPLLCLLRTF